MTRLSNWENIADHSTRVVAVLADSTAELDYGTSIPPWPQIIREKMKDRWGISGTGFRGNWKSEWSFTSGGDAWTSSTQSDSWSKAPYDGGFIANCHTMLANGSTKTATWTKPSWLTQSITSFKLYVVDGASSGDFAYRIDGGAWTDVSSSWDQNSSLDVITIPSAVSSTVQVRGANAVGTAQNIYLVGLEANTGTGSTLHDISASAQGLYTTANLTGNADYLAWIDVIQPDIIIVSFTNDLQTSVYNTTTITNKLQAIATRQQPYGYVVPMPFWGQDRYADGCDDARNTQLAGIYTSNATTNNSEYIDLWARYGNYAAVNGLGYMQDTLHPSDSGGVEIAKLVWPLLARGTGNTRVRSS